ncbi:ABC transporter ATP-binding protein [Acholeplasma hippikon]|uniref:ABC transporter ATP-binding protein n=1 Tax=Acholeplasma hippikon TaxID=264636 RepID=A0A449BHY1_9MOLU|nr:ATP-binding cassette domain-containing protein [Acholeplasma hippikon]VEU82042.1 ABC transporter ATP-binding protein [Acholeplasma hippikon]
MIVLENVNQSYGTKDVLKNINVSIPENKITAIIGPNGAGKSTLFNAISRMIPIKTGSIKIDGIEINQKGLNVSKLISVLKQQNHFNLKLTAYELISFGRYPHSKGKLNENCIQKIEEVIKYLKLESVRNQYIDTLSGGQLQRVLLAMILVQDTKYILLDEPLNNLDMKYAVEMMLLLQKFVEELGKTIVVVMHDINIASTFCDHVIAIKDGEVAYDGNINDMMHTDVLNNVYDHQFCIREVDGKKICVFHNIEKNL